MSKETEAIESFLVLGNGRSHSVVANGGSPLRKRWLSSPQTGLPSSQTGSTLSANGATLRFRSGTSALRLDSETTLLHFSETALGPDQGKSMVANGQIGLSKKILNFEQTGATAPYPSQIYWI